MGKVRPGSRRGMTKLCKSAKRAARKKAAQQRSRRPLASSVPHETIRSAWDSQLTPEKNLAKIGLRVSVNDIKKKAGEKEVCIPIQSIASSSQSVIKELEKEAAVEERRNLVVRPGERRALEAMLRRHDEDWEAMARDIKLNYLQWTPTQLRRKVERMRSVDAMNLK